MTSVFNPDEFLSATHEGGFATKRPHVPEGEYIGQLLPDKAGLDIKPVQVDGITRLILALNWELIDDNARAVTGLDKPRVKQDIWLDIDENGKLIRDKTHNVDLGRFLAGVGLNKDGWSGPQLRTLGLSKLKIAVDPNKKVQGEYFNRVVLATKYNGAA